MYSNSYCSRSASATISQQRYEERQPQRSVAALKRRAAALGFDLNPYPVRIIKQEVIVLFLESIPPRCGAGVPRETWLR